MARRDIWDRLNHFRTSKWGVALFYGYLVALLVSALVIAGAVRGNHALAIKANAAAIQAKIAAEVADRSLCSQKRANLRQLRAAKQFLHDHPHGTADFSRRLIMDAIHNDEVDVAALHDVVHCNRYAR